MFHKLFRKFQIKITDRYKRKYLLFSSGYFGLASPLSFLQAALGKHNRHHWKGPPPSGLYPGCGACGGALLFFDSIRNLEQESSFHDEAISYLFFDSYAAFYPAPHIRHHQSQRNKLSARITGAVTDTSGAAVPDTDGDGCGRSDDDDAHAEITDSGATTSSNLPIGTYTLTFTHACVYEPQKIPSITVQADRR